MTIKSKALYIFSTLAILFAGCTDDFMSSDKLDDNIIAFSSHVDGAGSVANTRSDGSSPRSLYDGKIQVESNGLGQVFVHTIIDEGYNKASQTMTRAEGETANSQFGDFYVTAHADNSEGFYPDESETLTPNFMLKEVVKKQGNNYRPEHNRYWPDGDSYLRFFAFYTSKKGDEENHNGLQYTHTVSGNVDDQNDVMVAVSGPVSAKDYRQSKEPVPLQFHHIFTQVSFRLAQDNANRLKGYKIVAIRYNDIVCSGTFNIKNFDENNWKIFDWEKYGPNRETYQTRMWTKAEDTDKLNLVMKNNNGGTPDENDYSGFPIMMIPQELNGVTVTLVLLDDNKESLELTVPLDGRKWIMGDKVEYVLSSSGDITEDIFEIKWKNGENFTNMSDENHEWGLTLAEDGSRIYTWHAPYYDINYYDNSEVDMTDSFQIISYRQTVNKTGDGDTGEIVRTSLDWSMTGQPYSDLNTYEDEGKIKGAWLKERGSTTGTNESVFTLKVGNQTLKKIDPRESLYKGKSPEDFLPPGAKDSEGYWDLSMKYVDAEGNPVMNTANCYIINAPGKYKFPAIYGNAISHGKINCYSFKDTRANHNILGTFYEANISGNLIEIDGPVIKGTYTPTFIWTDSREIQVNVEPTFGYVTKRFKHIDGSEEEELTLEYIRFEVKEENLQQGNFSIGFKSYTNGVRWSWHLWVTPYSSDESKISDSGLPEEDRMQRSVNVTDNEGDSYEIMPYNIGWCDRLKIHFGDGDFKDPRPRVYVNTYTQESTGKVIKLRISQRQADEVQYGNNMLFQWGRMAPLRGSYIFQTLSPTLKNFYSKENGSDEYIPMDFGRPTGKKNIPNVLASPANVFLGDGLDDWCVARYDNLWTIEREIVVGKDENGNPKKSTRYYKTIYDPSPVGYMVPPANVFDNMENSAEWSESPIWGMKVSISDKDVYFPVTGYRETDSNATLTGAGQRAFYLTSSIVEANGYGYVDGINIGRIKGENGEYSNSIDPNAIFSRVISGAVRPIREPGYDFLNVDHFVPDNDIIVDMQ